MSNLNELLNNYLAGNHEDVRLALEASSITVSELLELYTKEHNPDGYSIFLFVKRLTDEQEYKMDDLTCGMIDQEKVDDFYRCLVISDGHLHTALQNANDEYGYHIGVTEDHDSWHEALARYRADTN